MTSVRGAGKKFLEVKGVNQGSAPETLREKCLERRDGHQDSKPQQHQGGKKPPYGHWCTLMACEAVSPAYWPPTAAGMSRDMGVEGSLAHQAPECSNLTTRGGTRAKVDPHPEPGFFPETGCPEERGRVYPIPAPQSLEGLTSPCDL